MDDALGPAGGAARVADQHRIVGREARMDARVIARRDRVIIAFETLAAATDREYGLKGGDLSAPLGERIGVRLVAKEHARGAIVQGIEHFVCVEANVERHLDHACLEDRCLDHDEGVAVGQDERHPVAGRGACMCERAGEPVRLSLDLGEAQPPLIGDQRGLVAEPVCRELEQPDDVNAGRGDKGHYPALSTVTQVAPASSPVPP